MTLRSLIITTICIGLNSSLCTGGIFSVSSALANQLALQEDASEPMSYSSMEYLTCKSSTHVTDSIGILDLGGCKNSSTCFTQATSILEERNTPSLVAADSSIPLQTGDLYLYADHHERPLPIARAGPLYEYSILQAHTLLKRE